MSKQERGSITYFEVAIASMILTILIMGMIYVLRITSKGVIKVQRHSLAMSLAKEKVESIKNEILNVPWERAKIDLRDLSGDCGVTLEDSYNNHSIEAVTIGGNVLLVDPLVRYVNEVFGEAEGNTYDTYHYKYVPTPRCWPDEDEEESDMVLVRVEVLYPDKQITDVKIDDDGKWEIDEDTGDWQLYEAHDFSGTTYHGEYRRLVMENVVTNRRLTEPLGIIECCVFDADTLGAIEGALVKVKRMDTGQQVAAMSSDSNGRIIFEDVPTSPPNYWLESGSNYSIGYTDASEPYSGAVDWDPFTGLEVFADQVSGSCTGLYFLLSELPQGQVVGYVFGDRDWVGDAPTTLEPMGFSRCVVSADDIYSRPVTTDANGYFFFDANNTLETGVSVNFTASIYDPDFELVRLVSTPLPTPAPVAGVEGVTFAVVPLGSPITVTIYLDAEYSEADISGVVYGAHFEAPVKIPLTLAAVNPVTVRIDDGRAEVFGQNPVTIDGVSGGFTVRSLSGGVTVQLEVLLNDPHPPDYFPNSKLAFSVNGDAVVTIPALQPAGTLVGNIGGLGGGYDYSEMSIGIYSTDDELKASFFCETDGTFEYNYVPVTDNPVGLNLTIKPILSAEFSSWPDEQDVYVTIGAPTTLPDDSPFDDGYGFTLSRENGFVVGQVFDANGKAINYGVLVMAVWEGLGFPGSLGPGTINFYSTVSDARGWYRLQVGISGSATGYDLRCKNQVSNVDLRGVLNFEDVSINESVTVQSVNDADNPVTQNFNF